MKKLKTTKVEHQGREYFFVSKTDGFLPEEIQYYFDAQLYRNAEHLKTTEPLALTPGEMHWHCQEGLERVFLEDMRVMGLEFCKKKYGQSEKNIRLEVQRLNPGMKVKS